MPLLKRPLAQRCGLAILQRFAVPRRLLLALLGGLIAASWAAPAQAQVLTQIQLVGYSTSTLSSTAATSYSVTVPSGVLVGDFMLFVGSNNPGTGGGNPSGWTYLASNITSGTNGNTVLGFSLWYRIATSADVAGSTSYTWTVTGSSRVGGAISAFRGVDNTNPVVGFSSSSACTYTTGVGCATSATSTASTTLTAPSLTPGVANSTLVALYSAANGTDTPTVPSGTTQIFAAGTGTTNSANGLFLSAFYQRFTAATASGTFVSTGSTSAVSLGGTVALQPATVTPSAYWHFDQTAWTGAAGEVIDSGGSGYNSVAAHSATTSITSPALSGSPGTCNYGVFNGSTQYVEMPGTLPHVGNEFTIAAWIRPTANQAGRIWLDDESYNGYALSFGDSGSAKLRIYSRQPSTVSVDSNITLTLNTWYFVALVTDVTLGHAMYLITFDSAGNNIDTTSLSRTSFSAGTGSHATVGGTDDGDSQGTFYRFPGNIDEVTMFLYDIPIPSLQVWAQMTHPCPSYNIPNHYALSTPGTAVNCAPAAVTITAHSSTHAAIATTDSIAIATSTSHGDWTLTTGGGTFTANGSDTGSASYTFVTADAGVVVLALRDTHAEAVTISVTDGSITATSGTATAAEDSPLTFVASGFIVTNGSNVATVIGTQVAAVTSTQSLALQAVRTDTKTGACTAVFASGKSVNIGLGYQCNNPTTCVSGQTLKLTNNGTTTGILSNPNSSLSNYTTVAMTFSTANAEAPFTLAYSDAGQISLDAKYTIPLGSGASSGSTMLGASNQFVVQPYTLQLSAIKTTGSSFGNPAGFANPAASTPTGTVFIGAGQAFSATVTALNYLGAATPNFGQETSPAAVSMATNQVLSTAVGGSDFPAVSGSFGTYASGGASGTAFSWPEVGIMTITPSVASYLGSTPAVTGTTTGNVGRFIPNNFSVTLNTPLFAYGCTAGSFTYLGQPFVYATAPVITATAQSLGGTTTFNYTGSLFRLSDSNYAVTSRPYTPTPSSPTLITTGLPATTSDPTIVSSGNGVGTLTFSAGTGLSFTRGTPIAPMSTNIALSYNVIDLDSVAATANPVTFGANTGIQFPTSSTIQYYGRLALRDALGSELLDLPMQLVTQYYFSNSVGFVTNTSDSCTTAPAITFSNWQQPLVSGKTCVRDSGSPGASGQGCSAAAANGYAAFAVAGAFNLILSAPGLGFSGAENVTATAPSWLQYLWNTPGSNSSPIGMATFGVFPGSPTRIYQREAY
jgi:MSHA biogenesis protein MshQ